MTEFLGDPSVKGHITKCLRELIDASGGRVGSRNVGRYLSACPSSAPLGGGIENDTALKEMKKHFGSLAKFLDMAEADFFRDNSVNYKNSWKTEEGFWISVKEEQEEEQEVVA